MKIISKYKDFYDFLSGIYGEDPLIVLNRLDFTMPTFYDSMNPNYIEEGKIQLYIGGFLIEAYYKNDKIYYGEDLKQFAVVQKRSKWYYKYHSSDNDSKPEESVTIKIEKSRYNYDSFNLLI